MSASKPATYLDPVREAQAVQALRESLAQLGEDEALLLDTIEGQTGLFEAFDKLLLRMTENRAMIAGIGQVSEEIDERKRRFEKRLEADRALIEQAMMIAELDKVERPAATLSLAKRAPSLVVTTEADIPAEFWKAADPKLDRKALAAAIAEGRSIPGAELSNAAPSLTVRNR